MWQFCFFCISAWCFDTVTFSLWLKITTESMNFYAKRSTNLKQRRRTMDDVTILLIYCKHTQNNPWADGYVLMKSFYIFTFIMIFSFLFAYFFFLILLCGSLPLPQFSHCSPSLSLTQFAVWWVFTWTAFFFTLSIFFSLLFHICHKFLIIYKYLTHYAIHSTAQHHFN